VAVGRVANDPAQGSKLVQDAYWQSF